MTVSPDMHSPRGAGDRSRQKSQLPGKVPALWGADAVQREGPMWASDTKLKRPILERRNLVPSSQPLAMSKNTSERSQKRGPTCPFPEGATSSTIPGLPRNEQSSSIE
ncbi:hypothetical protein QTO34_009197 [Cnephaeus nilssonii]|uniref:RING-type E3 ubiquitin transferase n=1 Tax=Cnephaeus nilssonii TaxID=3371016 RepID=A0AA40LF60_CNENI|nr:hypothetical protein QTO34_009197 [Eptesicus nilssonii]